MFLKNKFKGVHMKKIFALIFAMVFSSSLFAAYQFTVTPTPYDNSHGEGTAGNYFVVNVTGNNVDFYITDRINNSYSMTGNNQVLAKVMSNYGYINLNSNPYQYIEGTGETKVIAQHQEPYNELVYKTAYKVGTFNEGDTFGIWIENKSDERNTSVYTEYSKHASSGLDGLDIFGDTMAELDYTTSPTSIFFGFYAEGAGVTFGQPLPGMFATFLLGGSVLGGAAGLKRRRNRA
jgi:hypothetical protein